MWSWVWCASLASPRLAFQAAAVGLAWGSKGQAPSFFTVPGTGPPGMYVPRHGLLWSFYLRLPSGTVHLAGMCIPVTHLQSLWDRRVYHPHKHVWPQLEWQRFLPASFHFAGLPHVCRSGCANLRSHLHGDSAWALTGSSSLAFSSIRG